MARGKKTDIETIYKVMINYFTTGNANETARQLNMPETTIKDIIKKNKDKDEFVKLRGEKKEEFVDKASRIIDKSLELMEDRIDTARLNQNELEKIIQMVWEQDKKSLNETQKKMIVNKIGKMQLTSLSELTTALGTLYDKSRLAKGESTGNTEFKVEIKVIE